MSQLRRQFSYANVVATLALILAAGTGGAVAAKELIDTDDIEKNAITSKLIDNGQVKSKDLKDNKGVKGADVQDGSLSGADIGAAAVATANLADGAVGSGKIAAGAVGSAELTNLEAPHLVGSAGEPAFGDGGEGDCLWRNVHPPLDGITGLNPVSFYKDPLGIVHLEGLAIAADGSGGDAMCGGADGITDSIAFTLPPAYRPQTSGQYDAPGGFASGVLISGVDSGGRQHDHRPERLGVHRIRWQREPGRNHVPRG